MESGTHIYYRILAHGAYPYRLTNAAHGGDIHLRFDPMNAGTLRVGRALLPLTSGGVTLRRDLLDEGENVPLLFLAGRTVKALPFLLQKGRILLSDSVLTLGETIAALDTRLAAIETTVADLARRIGQETVL